jgi:gas vesicle protein
MKDKIIMLIIGILIGAVITAGCFLIFKNNSNQSDNGQRRNGQSMGNFTPGEMPSEGKGMQETKNNSVTANTTSTSNSTTSSTSATSNN